MLRLRDDGRQALVVAHTFDTPDGTDLLVDLPAGTWALVDAFHTDAVATRLDGARLTISARRAFAGLGVLLQQVPVVAKAQT